MERGAPCAVAAGRFLVRVVSMTSWCLELFSGIGGASLGLHAAGWVPVLGVDVSEAACALRRAWGMRSRATRVDADVLTADFGAADIGLLWASPPCQAWSEAQTRGPRGACDIERNGWPVTLDVVRGVRPTWVVCENVGGSRAYVRDHVLPALREQYPFVEDVLLDAQDFGVPQTRRRLFVVAGPALPPTLPTQAGATRVSLGDALPQLRDRSHPANANLVYHLTGRGGTEPWRLDAPAPTVTTTEEKGTRATSSSRWTFNGGPDRASDAAFLATGRRRLEWHECAVLQGFPPEAVERMRDLLARRQTTVHDLYTGIGNAVAPPVACAVGQALLRAPQ